MKEQTRKILFGAAAVVVALALVLSLAGNFQGASLKATEDTGASVETAPTAETKTETLVVDTAPATEAAETTAETEASEAKVETVIVEMGTAQEETEAAAEETAEEAAEAEEEEPVCTCGAAEGEKHAKDCPLYEAPECRAWLTTSVDGAAAIEEGTAITLYMHLEGYDNCDVTVTWQHSEDAVNWIDAGNGMEYTFVIGDDNCAWYWHAVLTVVELA